MDVFVSVRESYYKIFQLSVKEHSLEDVKLSKLLMFQIFSSSKLAYQVTYIPFIHHMQFVQILPSSISGGRSIVFPHTLKNNNVIKAL